MEKHRTQIKYDQSISSKMLMFQFFNFYIYPVFVCFLKGHHFVKGSPDSPTEIFGVKIIYPIGSTRVYDTTLSILFILIGRGIMIRCLTILVQYLGHKFRMRIIQKNKTASRWEKDYQLADWCHTNTHFMYSEMLLQFGFLTLFFSFIPIGPIYALFYNLFDIRTNARNLLKHAKRPLPEKSFGIGATQWNLEFLSKLAILFNSILIGFTSA